jgi:hypothetical protein
VNTVMNPRDRTSVTVLRLRGFPFFLFIKITLASPEVLTVTLLIRRNVGHAWPDGTA